MFIVKHGCVPGPEKQHRHTVHRQVSHVIEVMIEGTGVSAGKVNQPAESVRLQGACFQ